MIECQHIFKNYENSGVVTEVLKDISFTVKDGEFVAITGPSGSGKSTLMHIIGALDAPTSGKYMLDGEDTSKMSDDELAIVRRKKIGFVFQSFNLLSRATVIRNVALPLVYSGIKKSEREKIAKKCLTESGFDPERFYHLSNQLSGGQMQRVAIARSLVNNPAIILADEPTGNLDSKTGDIVLATFQKLNDEGHTIILITHEQYVAEHADRIIIIKDGKIVSNEINTHKKIIHLNENEPELPTKPTAKI
jgi:putative ABC transport system ATP-binding protein